MGPFARELAKQMEEKSLGYHHLDRAARWTAAVASGPRAITFSLVAATVFVAWLVLLSMAGQLAPGQPMPGSALLQRLPAIDVPPPLDALVAYCLSPMSQDQTIRSFVALALMWFTMSLAMMLPSAAPLIRTYCEIADTARASGKRVVHPLLLVGGYLSVWLIASIAFAAVGLAVASLTSADTGYTPVSAPVAATALALAGLYQFSSLKEACLTKCRNPFSTLFAHWSFRASSIFSLGVKQGLWCLGCCWALMLVMFAVGIMNVFWMALLTVLTAVEKTGRGKLLSGLAGAVLLAWASAVLIVSIQ